MVMEQKIKIKDLLKAAKYLGNSKEEFVSVSYGHGIIMLTSGDIKITLRDKDTYMSPTVCETKPLPEMI